MKRAERLCDTVLRLESFAASEKKKNPAFRDYTGEKLSLAAGMFKGAVVVFFFYWHETSLSSCSDQCVTIRLVKQAACFCAVTQTLLLRFAGI